jgi:hypothetical protein
MKTPKRRKRPEPKQPRWFIVRRGWVQYTRQTTGGVDRVELPLFSDRAAAVKFIDRFMSRMPREGGGDSPMRPAEIGTLEGETLSSVLTFARDNGVAAAVWVKDFTDTGFEGLSVPFTEQTT